MTALLDRDAARREITVRGPDGGRRRRTSPGCTGRAPGFWTLAVTRELDDLILDLRTNELELGTWVLRTDGDAARVLGYDALLLDHRDDWLANEIVLYLKRTLKRLDVTSRSLIALIEPGSCFAGSLLELALAADRSYQLAGVFEDVDPDAEPAAIMVGDDEPRAAADGQRPDPAADPVPRRRRRAGRGRASGRASRWRPRTPRRSAWSRSPRTTSTGTRRSASRSRSGPASARTR